MRLNADLDVCQRTLPLIGCDTVRGVMPTAVPADVAEQRVDTGTSDRPVAGVVAQLDHRHGGGVGKERTAPAEGLAISGAVRATAAVQEAGPKRGGGRVPRITPE